MARFWSYVTPEPNTGCWLWAGGMNSRGYGSFRIRGRQYGAHRVSLALKLGADLGKGINACHRCDMPPCVNPDHLFAGTQKENIHDCRAKGRWITGDKNGSRTRPERSARGERVNTARLTAEMVLAIRALAAAGESLTVLARENGVTRPAIAKVVARQSWAHVKAVSP